VKAWETKALYSDEEERNVNGVPMPDSRWLQFVHDVCDVVEKHERFMLTRAWGVGEWDGQTEESFQVTLRCGRQP
jgi:hypothetical protein